MGASPLNAPARHVVLISIDALRPEFFLESTWPAPTLQRLASGGALIPRLRSVTPSLTYPAHATLATGALPARHGIVYNRPFEAKGTSDRWHWASEGLRSPPLWEAVRLAGGRSASVTWPVTVGAEIEWNVPEVWDPFGRVPQLELVRRHTTPPGLLDELEREATGPLTPDVLRGRDLARAEAMSAMGGYLLETYRPDLLMIHFVVTDAHQHAEGREGPGVRRAVAAVDRAVGRMVDAARRAGLLERTAFVITGDHGFLDVHAVLAPNVWLAEAGLRSSDSGRGEWRATFHVEDGAAFLHLRESGDVEGMERVRRVLEAVSARVRRSFRVVEKDELDARGAAPEAALALTAAAGTAFTEDAGGKPIRDGSGGAHGHFPDLPEMDTGLLAWGSGIRAGGRLPVAELTDVAPLVAALLGADFVAPDGHLPRELLD